MFSKFMKAKLFLIYLFFLTLNTLKAQLYINDTLFVVNGTLVSVQESEIACVQASNFQQGKLVINGSSGQTVSGTSSLIVDSITIDNTNNITLQTELGAKSHISFTNGKVTTDATNANHFLHFLDNATYSGYSPTKFVDGRVRKTGNDAFIFPLGNSTYDAPLSISAPANTTDHFTAYYKYASSPYSVSSKESVLSSVSNTEYWILDRTNGTSNVAVTLSWAARSASIGNLAQLKVSRWDGFQWTDAGQASTTGNTSAGTIVSNTVSSFSPFTLAAYSSCPTAPTLIKRD